MKIQNKLVYFIYLLSISFIFQLCVAAGSSGESFNPSCFFGKEALSFTDLKSVFTYFGIPQEQQSFFVGCNKKFAGCSDFLSSSKKYFWFSSSEGYLFIEDSDECLQNHYNLYVVSSLNSQLFFVVKIPIEIKLFEEAFLHSVGDRPNQKFQSEASRDKKSISIKKNDLIFNRDMYLKNWLFTFYVAWEELCPDIIKEIFKSEKYFVNVSGQRQSGHEPLSEYEILSLKYGVGLHKILTRASRVIKHFFPKIKTFGSCGILSSQPYKDLVHQFVLGFKCGISSCHVQKEVNESSDIELCCTCDFKLCSFLRNLIPAVKI